MSVTAENIGNNTQSLPNLGRRTREGVASLTESERIAILQDRKLHKTQSEIARERGINRITVARVNENQLSLEGKAKLDTFAEKLDRIRHKASARIEEKIDNDTLAPSIYPALLKVANESYRLETNQSTANINVNVLAVINKDVSTLLDAIKGNPHGYDVPTRQQIVEKAQEYCQLTQQEYDESELTCLALLDE